MIKTQVRFGKCDSMFHSTKPMCATTFITLYDMLQMFLHCFSGCKCKNKKLCFCLETGRQQCISLQLSYFLSP